MDVVIHSNPSLENQRVYADGLKRGFERQGVRATVTAAREAQGDVHIIQGPHYAYKEWVGKPNVLFLNRCFYGDGFENVSLGWLNPDGSRRFAFHADRSNGRHPAPEARKPYRGTCVVFGDYGRDPAPEVKLAREEFERVYFRAHPAGNRDESPVLAPDWTLGEAFSFADCAVGHSSTVLVKARINGLKTLSTDPNHVVLWEPEDRLKWLSRLSWCQWSFAQIRNGEFWEHLSEGFDSTNH